MSTYIDAALAARWLAAEAPAIRDDTCWYCGQPFETRDPDQGLCYACLGLAAEDTRPAPEPDAREPTCLACGRDTICADCARPDWWEGVELPELYESVHEMARKHSHFA